MLYKYIYNALLRQAMALEKETLQTLNNLNKVLMKLDNTVASFVGKERANNSPGFSGESPNKKDPAEKFDSSVEKLSKSAENARKSLDKNINDAAKHMSTGFTDILKRMGTSITNEFPGRREHKIISESLKGLEDDISGGSLELRDGIRNIAGDILSKTGMDANSLLISANSVNDKFLEMNDIVNDAIKSNKITNEQYNDLINTIDELNDSGIDIVEAFGDTGGELKDFINALRNSKDDVVEINDENMDAFRDFNKNMVDGGNIFANSMLNLSKNIEDGLAAPIKNLQSKVDDFGKNLMGFIRGGLGAAVAMEANTLSTLVQEGFRDVDLIDLGISAADFGQSQQEFAQNLGDFRTVIRLLGQSSNAMGFSAGDTFNAMSEDIRDRFGITGGENTQFLGKQLEALTELGIKPTIDASKELNEEIQVLSGITNKSAAEINDAFLGLSKDKSFKAFFMSIGGADKGLSGLTKKFTTLQKQTGMNIDEFVSLQQEVAAQRSRTGSTRVVEGAMAGRLAEELDFSAEEASLIRQFVSFNESLSEEQRVLAEELLATGGARLTEARNQAAATRNVSELQTLDILAGRAGIFGQERPEMLSKQKSGTVELFQQHQEAMIENAKIETDAVTKFATSVSEFIKGIAKSPIGVAAGGIAGLMGDLGMAALGATLANKGVGGLLGGAKGVVSGLWSGLKSGLKSGLGKISWGGLLRSAGLLGVGVSLFDGFRDAISDPSSQGILQTAGAGLWNSIGNIIGGIPDALLGTDIAGFFREWNPFDELGTWMGETAASIVETVSGWFGNIGDTLTGWFDTVSGGISSAIDGAGDMVSGIVSDVGDVLDEAGGFIVDGFSNGWDAITSFFGDDETPSERISRKEQELLAKEGQEELQQLLNKMSETMEEMTKEMKVGNEQANEHHIENKLNKKMENRKRINGMKAYDKLGQSPAVG